MGFIDIIKMEKNLKGMLRVCYTLKDKEQYKGIDKDMKKEGLIKFPKVS